MTDFIGIRMNVAQILAEHGIDCRITHTHVTEEKFSNSPGTYEVDHYSARFTNRHNRHVFVTSYSVGEGCRDRKVHPADILSVVFSDADVLNYDTFEEWAIDVGLDPDSRRVEKAFNDGNRNVLALWSFLESIDSGLFSELENTLQDY